MAIIISKNGKDAVKVDKSDFQLEDKLQQYIYDNPESIPLYDIKEDIRLLILAREFTTKSGSIDALGVDKDGEIYLVETKFYKNPDKRTVVAQVLDYGAALWSSFRDFNDFAEQVSYHTNKDFNQNLNQRICDFFGISDEETDTLLENAKQNLRDGNFKFVVLMDHLHDQLKDLIIFLNNNSEFTVYAVELEYYKHEEFEILIPKIYGAEVKKSIGINATRQKIPTDEEFIHAYQGREEQEKLKQLFNFFNDLKEGRKEIEDVTASKTPKYLNFNISLSQNEKIYVSLGINPEYEGGGLQFWTPKEYEKKSKELIKQSLGKGAVLKDLKTQSGKIAKWQLEDYSTEKFEELLRNLAKI
ncbi:MAG: hypothetical protein A2126_00525 [Candidatus Woykebacteria bacterium GWB1_45_5]|uniref:DUF91 domain-containing protein n=1 Tax=Candidatus Woykebacteria bacterium GWB1_45_5 TaxID=1802592 RepID=A0A1G1W842_9BACT|nr:MAG: hypothetical protein A2126_00525 [Candidatus Woykebacteria bacterium GWB1_45_5]